ncbi:hypothetical protein H0H93_011259 [Arthromyces matolae]|nr:hypothetical protein H0H93_011259 [Arthromyces matolae]
MSRDRLAAARASFLKVVYNNFAELLVSSIQEGIERLNANVHQISTLHGRIMNTIDSGQSHDNAQLDQLAAETRTLINSLKDRIKTLERAPLGADTQMRRNRLTFVRSKFLEALQNYQRVEQEYRVKSRQRVERQLKIVKSDATPEEVAAAVEGGGQQIFAQALTTSSRYAEGRMAYREVQERQTEIKKMEETLAELAQLFIDMGTLVEQQEETIVAVEQTAMKVEEDTGKATEQTWKAVLSASPVSH